MIRLVSPVAPTLEGQLIDALVLRAWYSAIVGRRISASAAYRLYREEHRRG